MRKYLISLSVLMMLVFVAVLYTGCNENNIETEERVFMEMIDLRQKSQVGQRLNV